VAQDNNQDSDNESQVVPTQVQQENAVDGFTAPNRKPAWLQEVEDDATYITQKRIDEHFEEQKREAEKLARQAEAAKKGK
jgi:hypothetical protein